MNSKIQKAWEQERAAARRVDAAVAEAYPVGSRVSWRVNRGGRHHMQVGVVMFHRTSEHRVRVRNVVTGRESEHHFTELHAIGVGPER